MRKKIEMLQHLCPDGTLYKWIPRKEPQIVKSCPRCKYRLDAPKLVKKENLSVYPS